MHIKVEQLGMAFHVHALRIHANGDVALQQQTLVVQGFDRLTQLLVAVVLQEEMNLCAVAIALGAILDVVGEPVFVVFGKLLEICGFFQRVPLLREGDLEIFPFGFLHFGVVDEVGFVELLLQFAHVIPNFSAYRYTRSYRRSV